MYQQLWGYKVEEKLYLGVREQKRLNTTGLIQFFQTVVRGTPFVHGGPQAGSEEKALKKLYQTLN
jgi:hypothetical protein